MNAQMIQFPFFGKTDRIIQILCIFAVYRNHFHIPQIHAPCHIGFLYFIRNPLRLIHYFFPKFDRQVKAADNRHNIHSRVIDMPQDFHHFSLRLVVLISVACQLHYYLMPIYRSFRTLFGNKNIRSQFSVIRNHKAKRCRLLIRSHNLTCAMR